MDPGICLTDVSKALIKRVNKSKLRDLPNSLVDQLVIVIGQQHVGKSNIDDGQGIGVSGCPCLNESSPLLR